MIHRVPPHLDAVGARELARLGVGEIKRVHDRARIPTVGEDQRLERDRALRSIGVVLEHALQAIRVRNVGQRGRSARNPLGERPGRRRSELGVEPAEGVEPGQPPLDHGAGLEEDRRAAADLLEERNEPDQVVAVPIVHGERHHRAP